MSDPFFITDRTWFYLNDFVNIQNYQIWFVENADVYSEQVYAL